MREQLVLFDTEPAGHLDYLWANRLQMKRGIAKNIDRRWRGDAQFKGLFFVSAFHCTAAVHIIDGRKKCERELKWEEWFAAERLPNGEHYAWSEYIDPTVDREFNIDARSAAILKEIRRQRVAGAA